MTSARHILGTVQAILDAAGTDEPRAVLLVGSRADGVAAADANVNVLVLHPAPPSAVVLSRPAPAPRAVRRPITLFTNIVVPGTPELSIEIVDLPGLERVEQMMSGICALDNPMASELELPAPDVMEIRFLARLRSGRVIQGADVADEWRGRLHTDRLPSLYAVCTFLVARHYGNRAARAAREEDRLTAGLLSHTAAEHLAYAAAALHGVVLHEPKKLGQHISVLVAAAAPLPRVLTELERFMYAEGVAVRIELLAEWSGDLLDRLTTDPAFEDAAAFVHERLSE